MSAFTEKHVGWKVSHLCWFYFTYPFGKEPIEDVWNRGGPSKKFTVQCVTLRVSCYQTATHVPPQLPMASWEKLNKREALRANVFSFATFFF